MPDFLKAISEVKTIWTVAAFGIAAILALTAHYGAKPGTAARRGLYVGLAAVVVLALAPIGASLYSESAGRATSAIYRLRVTTVDFRNVPVSDVVVRSTALEESKSTVDGTVELTIPSITLPADKKITIFAAKPAAFLHANVEMTLGGDHSPSITVALREDPQTKVRGAVQDSRGHLLAGAEVTVPGYSGSVITGGNGAFEIDAHAALGHSVRVHVEKSGYKPVDQDHVLGSEPAIVQLSR